MRQKQQPDRYLSFAGIEGDRNSQELIALLRHHIDRPENGNRFWDAFKAKLALVGRPERNGGRCLDELFLIHCYLNDIRELLEEQDDQEALILLARIEMESC